MKKGTLIYDCLQVLKDLESELKSIKGVEKYENREKQVVEDIKQSIEFLDFFRKNPEAGNLTHEEAGF